MPPWVVALLIALFILIDLVVMRAVISMATDPIRKLGKRYPPQQPLPGHIRHGFQSLKVELLNMGQSVHLTIDERWLHIEPALVLRWIGVPSCSIPWDAIKYVRTRWGGSRVKIDGVELSGPKWAFSLAEAAQAEEKTGVLDAG